MGKKVFVCGYSQESNAFNPVITQLQTFYDFGVTVGDPSGEKVCSPTADVDYKGNLSYEAGYFVKTASVAFRRESAKYMAVVAKYLVERFEYYKAIGN